MRLTPEEVNILLNAADLCEKHGIAVTADRDGDIEDNIAAELRMAVNDARIQCSD